MGRYINELANGKKLPSHKKADFILSNIPEAQTIPEPKEFRPNLVCVVENGLFDAAAYCDSENEMKVFAREDGRNKTWLIVPEVEKIAN